MRTRRAASLDASRRAASRRATSGSWTFESAARPRFGQRFSLALDRRRRASATACRQLDQRRQVGPAEPLEARQHAGVPVGQHQRRDRVEAVLLGDEQLGVESTLEAEAVPLGENRR